MNVDDPGSQVRTTCPTPDPGPIAGTLPAPRRGSAREWATVIPTMMTREELVYLTTIAREEWDGSSDLVEFGSWLGASTEALARGMQANAARRPGARLHVVDSFVWHPFMDELAGFEL